VILKLGFARLDRGKLGNASPGRDVGRIISRKIRIRNLALEWGTEVILYAPVNFSTLSSSYFERSRFCLFAKEVMTVT